MSNRLRALFVVGLFFSQLATAQMVVRYPAPETQMDRRQASR